MQSFPLLAVPKLETTTLSFRQELVRQALDAGLDPNLVAAVISFESGFNPKAVNRYSGATGLIQWMPSNFPVPNLLDLSAEEQLPYALRWIKGKGVAGSTRATDYYLSVFLPAFIGAPSNLTVGRKGSSEPLRLASGKATSLSLGKMYEQNPAFDPSGKGYFTIGDVGGKIESLVSAARGRAPVPVPFPVTSPPRPRGTETGAPPPSQPTGSSSPRPSPPQLSPRIGSCRTVLRDKAPSVLPPLGRGSHGPAVTLLQRLLWATLPEGEDRSVDIDGEYGAQTELAVALHQHEAGLEPDGTVGALTWTTLAADEFWGPDRIGLQAVGDPYGEPSPTAPTLVAPALDRPTAAPFELVEPKLPAPPKLPSASKP